MSVSVKNKPAYQKLRRIVESSTALDVAEVLREIESLHSGRSTRTLSVRRLKGSSIAAASLQDQSYRSRIVELNLGLTRNYNLLSTAIEAATEQLCMECRDALTTAGYRSRIDKEKYIRSRLGFAHNRLADMSNAIEIANLVIEDIDKAGWSLKLTKEVLELATRPEITG